MCFFDGEKRNAPSTWREYCEADHVTVRFPDGGSSQRALTGIDTSSIQRARVSVPNFSAIPSFVKGTRAIATEMNFMKLCCLKELDMAPLPADSNPVQVFMTWHRRSNQEPANVWLREKIEKISRSVQSDSRNLK